MSTSTLSATLVVTRRVENLDQLMALRRLLQRFLDMEVIYDMYMWKPTGHVYNSEQDPYKSNYQHRIKLLHMLEIMESLVRRNWIINISFYINRNLS